MKRGFTLIELLVALAIASMAITLLFNSFFQTQRMVDRADDIISTDMRASLVHHHLQKDLMGTFIPVQAQESKTTGTQPAPKKSPTAKPAPKPPEPKKKKPLAKFFYGINKGQNLDTLTFITNNPMSAYWGSETGKAKPKIARVVYRLIEEKDRKNSFTLVRQEGQELKFDAYKQGETKEARAYELADGIKEFKLKYIVRLKEKNGQAQAGQKKAPVEFETLNQWDMEQNKEMEKKIERLIPNIVEISVSFWDRKEGRATEFTFSVPILPDMKPVQNKPPKPKTSTTSTTTGNPSTSLTYQQASPDIKKLIDSMSKQTTPQQTQNQATPSQQTQGVAS